VAERIKFYMDEHVAKSVTEGLRRRGADVVTVQELGLQAAEDQQHLKRAAQERPLWSRRIRTFFVCMQPGSPIEGLYTRLSRHRCLRC
jgi:hypothetical protein